MLAKSFISQTVIGKDKKILSIYAPPPFWFSLNAAVIDAIVLASEEAFDWFYSMHIGLVFYRPGLRAGDHSHKLGFYKAYISPQGCNRPYGQFLKRTVINDEIIKLDKTCLLTDIKRWIDNDWYIIFQADVSKIPGTRYHGNRSLRHSLLIFGYDDEKRMFKSLDFDKRGILKVFDVCYDDCINAVFSEQITKETALYKHCTDTGFHTDATIITAQLEDYLAGNNISDRYSLFFPRMDYVYGINVYDELADYISGCDKYIDYRAFHALWDHKRFMKALIVYLRKKELIDNDMDIDDEYTVVLKKSELLKNLVLKQGIGKEISGLDRMRDLILEIRDIEIPVLNKLLVDIKRRV